MKVKLYVIVRIKFPYYCVKLFTVDFFEECIKEKQYEAQKLDIMKDAVRAKVFYSEQTECLNGHSGDSRELSPLPDDSQSSITQNGETV